MPDPVAVPEPVAEEPPPLSTRALPETAADDPAPLGDAAEDGLRILAALETMESLEQGFCDDAVDEEASVTIIEHATPFDMSPPLDSAAAPGEPDRSGVPKAPEVDADRHAAYHGPIEEAVVEIFHPRGPAPEASEPPGK